MFKQVVEANTVKLTERKSNEKSYPYISIKKDNFNRWRMTMHIQSQLFWHHIKQHKMIYLFMLTLFITGIIFGALTVNSMTFIQKQDLFFYLDQYFQQVNTENAINRIDILKRSFFFHIKYLSLFFLLGITIIGIPIIWVLSFIKGVVIGFSVGFMVNQLGVKGLLLATISMAPQNMIIVPIYIIAGSLAMMFSLNLCYKLFGRSMTSPIGKPFIRYSFLFILLFFLAFASALVETFIANEAFKSLLKTGLYTIINIF